MTLAPDIDHEDKTAQRASLRVVDGNSEKPRPGRAKGLGKVPGSGRAKGVRNHASTGAKEDFRAVLDKNAAAIAKVISATRQTA